MNLFIDSNIFLDFYHFSKDDITELNKLVELITKKEISLFTTEQVIDEVNRNRDNKVADAYKLFASSKTDITLPISCRGYAETAELNLLQRKIKDLLKKIDEKYQQEISSKTLGADILINKLFSISTVLESDKYLDIAKARFLLGRPPGKDDSYGDALNWTSLLYDLPKEDIFLISGDKDYKSALDESGLNSYLKDEWIKKKGTTIFFYVTLSEFFNKHVTDIQLKIEFEKNELINRLGNSNSFSTTHEIISELASYRNFDETQLAQLVFHALNNNQISSILTDTDVKNFYSRLIINKRHLIDPDSYSSLIDCMLND